jgi:hypothetical protein
MTASEARRLQSRPARPCWVLALVVCLTNMSCWALAAPAAAQEFAASDWEPLEPAKSIDAAGPLDVIWQSIVGSGQQRPWTPLPIDTLLTEGWDEPWLSPPSGSGGAPRQGWVNAADGHFNRNFILDYVTTKHVVDGQDGQLGVFQFQSPLSRRLWISVDVPLVSILQTADGVPGKTSFGDLNLFPKVMLHETQDLSISAGLGVRFGTGDLATGSGQTRIFPQWQLWRDIGGGFVARGGLGVDVATNETMPPSALVSQAALGRFITPHNAAPLGDLAWSLAFVMRNNLGDPHTFVSLTPGIRTHLGHNIFFLAGYEIPLAGPLPFDDRLTFVLIQVF